MTFTRADLDLVSPAERIGSPEYWAAETAKDVALRGTPRHVQYDAQFQNEIAVGRAPTSRGVDHHDDTPEDALAALWVDKWGGPSRAQRVVQDGLTLADDLVGSMPAATRDGFLGAFSSLPMNAQMTCVDELANPYVPPGHAPQHQIQNFARTAQGAELIREWGANNAPANVHRATTRLTRFYSRLSRSERLAVDDALDRIPGAAWKAILKNLAA